MPDHRNWKPLEITPASVDAKPGAAGLAGYLDALPDLAERLAEERALVFRGFGVDPDELDTVMDRLLPDRAAYVHGNSPRTKVGRNVYTSTEYPPEFVISMHNELSYAHCWPSRLLFFCHTAPETGGATPVVNGALWLASLDDEVREAFAGGVRYTQNLHGGRGLGKSWQETFETQDRDAVEEFLSTTASNWTWLPGDALRVTQDRPSTLRHPVTGEEVWFNQSDQWHPAALGEDAAALARVLPADELPQSVCFADGSPIPDAYVLQVRDRGLAAAVDVDWHAGDLLLIDNVLVGHGRRSFTGSRRVLVAMSS
ncbi:MULTISPECIES: TauD/TfdA family dioxygenase [Streptomyces]|uniref:TauD/TfdA family dioxygenase n=1 Tax=Streptomyces TaxID=1883 RepID=UPI001E474966|nr:MULTISPECIES: TauD/TfdA family dioxygenase [Streptomyces]UFQ18543.1 TauD/TfdA family dioxygenase [Streptomyces huasconensis]WCL88157.1 TauD/TfdA family dioxygenase [Streptomyces sp. JCM 35825]